MNGKELKLVLGMSVLALGLAVAPAFALDLEPGDEIATAGGTGPCNADCIEAAVNPVLDPDVTNLVLQYKSNVGGSDEGPRAADYDTTYLNTPTDPEDAIIDYIGTTAINCVTQVCILEVKDGDHTPGRYFFNITGWNGIEDINLTGFWSDDNGAISHVAIYNGGSVSLPEPATLMLLGAGLAGLGIWRRKVSKG